MKTAYLFDIGNVILKFDFSLAAARIAPHTDYSVEEILPMFEPFIAVMETGQMSIEEFGIAGKEKLGYRGTPEELVAGLQDIFTDNPPMDALIEELAATGADLVLFSNTSALHRTFFCPKYPILEKFTGAIYSYEVGAMKPHELIYRAAVEQYGLVPENTIYVDDLPANIEAGIEHGFRGFQYDYNDHQALVDFIAEHA